MIMSDKVVGFRPETAARIMAVVDGEERRGPASRPTPSAPRSGVTGFWAVITSTYTASTGYSWKRQQLGTDGTLTDTSQPVTGQNLFDVNDNQGIPTGATIWVTPVGVVSGVPMFSCNFSGNDGDCDVLVTCYTAAGIQAGDVVSIVYNYTAVTDGKPTTPRGYKGSAGPTAEWGIALADIVYQKQGLIRIRGVCVAKIATVSGNPDPDFAITRIGGAPNGYSTLSPLYPGARILKTYAGSDKAWVLLNGQTRVRLAVSRSGMVDYEMGNWLAHVCAPEEYQCTTGATDGSTEQYSTGTVALTTVVDNTPTALLGCLLDTTWFPNATDCVIIEATLLTTTVARYVMNKTSLPAIPRTSGTGLGAWLYTGKGWALRHVTMTQIPTGVTIDSNGFVKATGMEWGYKITQA